MNHRPKKDNRHHLSSEVADEQDMVSFSSSDKGFNVKKYDKNVKAIQDMLKKNGVKMSAIEIRELMKTNGLSADEDKIKAYVRQLRRGY